MYHNSKNVPFYAYGFGYISHTPAILKKFKVDETSYSVFVIDSFFKNKDEILKSLSFESQDIVLFLDANADEITTDLVDVFTNHVLKQKKILPSVVVGMGGGSALDMAKAISNLLTNGGKAEDYQGWDLVKKPGVPKVGIPTLSGTGAEATRTCVMMNLKKNLKLGMNSEHTIYDQIILDPELTKTVPRDQYFYTGMDTYIHCLESLAGRHRHPIGDSFSRESMVLCQEVFLSEDMMSDDARGNMMVASYLGGCAIANSYVGLVHPFSAGLSVVLGTHHCLANCIVLNALEEFYPTEFKEFQAMVKKQKINIPSGICKDLSPDQLERLFLSTIIHEKPLSNALGPNFKDILTKEKVISIFKRM